MSHNVTDYIDLEGGLKRVRGNKKLYRRMLGMFEQSGEFAAFEDAITQGDMQRACDVIHGIKGMTGNLSLTRLFTLSGELNEQLRQGEYQQDTLTAYRQAYKATQECLADVAPQLED